MHPVLHQPAGVQHGPVVASAKGFADGIEGAFRHVSGQVHGNLPGKGDVLWSALARHVGQAEIEMLGHLFLNDVDANAKAAFLVQDFPQEALGDLDAQLFASEGGEGSDPDQRSFQPADIGANALGQEVDNLLRQLNAHELLLFAEDGHARFHIGRLQVGHQAPFEPRDEALLQVGDLARRPVAGHHYLFARLVQGVEGVKEFLLNAFLAGEEMDIVDEKHIAVAVSAAEADELVILNGVDEFVGKLLGRDIGHPGSLLVLDHVLADGVQQVSLAEPDATVKEQGIVGLARCLRDGHGSGVGKRVVVAHHEGVKRVLGVEGKFLDRCIAVREILFLLLPFIQFGWWRRLRQPMRAGHQERHLHRLARGSREYLAEQVQVIVLQPNFTELVGDLQSHGITVERVRPQRGEP